jgi:hypothetical protein
VTTELQVVGPTTQGLVTIEPQVSFLRLIQPTSRDLPGRAGQIYNTLTHEVHDNLLVCFVKDGFDRKKWPEGEFHSAKPLCKSSNGRTPDPDVLTPFAPECRLCPYQLEKYFQGRKLVLQGRPRPCKRSNTIEVVAQQTQGLHVLDCGGKSETPSIHAWVALRAEIARYKKAGVEAYPPEFVFRVSSTRVGSAFAFQFHGPEPNEDHASFGPVWEEVLARFL